MRFSPSPWLRRAVPSLAAVLMFGSCAKHARTGGIDMSPQIDLVVVNNLNPPIPFTLYVATENGSLQLMGTVRASRTESFHYRPLSSAERCRLVGRIAGGPELVSQIFTLTDVGGVTWDVRSNSVQFTDRP